MHAGDFMNAGYDLREVVSFNRWLGEQPFAHRIVCGGNHDRPFENSPELARSLLSNGIYLEDSGTTIAGFSFWGSPYTPASSTGLLCILAVKRQMKPYDRSDPRCMSLAIFIARGVTLSFAMRVDSNR